MKADPFARQSILSAAAKETVIVVTGGSSGIGKQLAVDFLNRGNTVIICSDNVAKLKVATDELNNAEVRVDSCRCDIRDMRDVSALADHVLQRYGHIDILINNAGCAVYRPFEESTTEEVCDLVDVNLTGAMRCTKAFLPSMIERRSGRIVNMSSIGGETIITPNAVYCAAKHGIVAWSKALRYELTRFNIKVNVVCPGHTKTDFHNHPTFRRRDPYRKKTARSLTVQEVSAATMKAVERDLAVSYVPKRLGLVAWALNALPFVTLPVWDRIAKTRIEQLYEQIDLENHSRHNP